MKKTLTMFLAVMMCAVMLSGCYGPFRLTKKVYDWNGKVGDKWINEVVFLAFNILPVYSITLLGDGIIFNSIEFWTGNNVFASSGKSSQIFCQGDRQAVMTLSKDRTMRVDVFDNYRPVSYYTVAQTPDGKTVAKNAQGEIIATH